MRTLSQASIDQPLGLRTREDVLAVAVRVADSSMWVVKDPITLEQYQLSEQEYSLLDRLRQPSSLRDLLEHFDRRFAPATARPGDLWSSIARLHTAGLLLGSLPGQGATLLDRADERRRQQLRWSWTQVLAIRFRGFHPDPFLTRLYTLLRPLLHPAMLVLAALLVLFAAGLLLTNLEQFAARLPTLSLLMGPSNWLWLIVAMALLKVLHELGHALAAKHFGAEVPEMGLLLLVFIPCLYCDVSDIWRLQAKWQRVVVSAAGMGVELVVASIATLVWWTTEPGLTNLVALNVMLIATIGTLLINANPLLRYDGYYILSDLTNTPNLWQRSRSAMHRLGGAWFAPPSRSTRELVPPPEPTWILAYGIASSLYLLLVLLAIFATLVTTLTPYRFEVIAYLLGCLMVATLLVGPMRQLITTLKNPVRRGAFRPLRATATLALVALGVYAAGHWPLVDRVECQATVAPRNAQRIFTTLGGRIAHMLPAGTPVEPGELIGQLENATLTQDALQVEAELAVARQRLVGLQALRARDPEASAKLPTAEAEVARLEERLTQLQSEQARLALRAPRRGVILPPPQTPPPRNEVTLAHWSGTPLEPHNRGAWLEPATLVALVGNPEQTEIVLAIDERDVERVQPGQEVRVQLDQLGGRVVTGHIVEVARRGNAHSDSSPQTTGLAHFVPHPLDPLATTSRYEARVALEEPREGPLGGLVLDGAGRAKIETGRTTLGTWLGRELRDTFRLP